MGIDQFCDPVNRIVRSTGENESVMCVSGLLDEGKYEITVDYNSAGEIQLICEPLPTENDQ